MFSSFEGADRRKEEARVRAEGRLPPGQALTFKFPVLHYGPVPHFNPATWDFRVWGQVEEEKQWTWDEFKPGSTHVMQHAEYGFTVNLPLEVVLQENFLLATHFNGEPISPDHGYPLRGVVGFIPGHEDLETPYLWKGAKWLRSLEFMTRDRRGFWEQAGYHNRADVWREERFG